MLYANGNKWYIDFDSPQHPYHIHADSLTWTTQLCYEQNFNCNLFVHCFWRQLKCSHGKRHSLKKGTLTESRHIKIFREMGLNIKHRMIPVSLRNIFCVVFPSASRRGGFFPEPLPWMNWTWWERIKPCRYRASRRLCKVAICDTCEMLISIVICFHTKSRVMILLSLIYSVFSSPCSKLEYCWCHVDSIVFILHYLQCITRNEFVHLNIWYLI